MTEETKKRRPFHETIIDSIGESSYHEISLLAKLIKTTKIPKGHDEIIEAWRARSTDPSDDDPFGVIADLLEQKSETEEKEKVKQAQMNMVNSIS